MATLYIWENHDLTGHASLSVGGYYASFHPLNHSRRQLFLKEMRGKSVERDWVITKEEDAKRPGYGKPCNSVNISCLNETAISNYMIDGIMDKDFPRYELFSSNCSTVVHRLFSIGLGLQESSQITLRSMTNKLRNHNWAQIMHPYSPQGEESSVRWLELAGNLVDTITLTVARMPPTWARMERRVAVKAFAAALSTVDAARRAVVWTPGDVLYFAEELNKAHQG